jgi:hypothetical protein
MGWASHRTRLKTLARRLGRCPVHPGEKLECPAGVSWAGNDAEFHELLALMEPTRPFTEQIRPQGRCPHCGHAMYCSTCWKAQAHQIEMPDVPPLSIEQMERLNVLLDNLSPGPCPGSP